MFSILVAPRFARLIGEAKDIRSKYFKLHTFLAVICIAVIALVAGFADRFIWILGSAYAHLRSELVVVIGSAAIGVAAGAAYELNAVRGIVFPPSVLIPVLIVTQVAIVFFLRIDSVLNAAILSLLLGLGGYVLHLVYGAINISGIKVTK